MTNVSSPPARFGSSGTLRRQIVNWEGLRAGTIQVARKAASGGVPPSSNPVKRRAHAGPDLRLDLFRGLALWLIFLDHIPSNIVSWITIRNFGLSDASEIFIFISGYTAALVHGKTMEERGFILGSARILRRAWQIYVAHLFLFVICVAEITYAASRFDEPAFVKETNVIAFLQHPDATIVQALLLGFKPVNLDVLPVYILFLVAFPPTLWLLRRGLLLPLVASVALYALTWVFDWNLPAYPAGAWFFNPLAWQLLFVLGAWCAVGGSSYLQALVRSRITFVLAAGYLLFAFALAMTWHSQTLAGLEPEALSRLVLAHPIDKTDLHLLRLIHFLALAALVLRFLPRDWAALKLPALRLPILCGQHSLEVFCFGTFLAFAGHFVIVEVWPGATAQILVSIAGIALMIGLAELIAWYQAIEVATRRPLHAIVPIDSRRGRAPQSPGALVPSGRTRQNPFTLPRKRKGRGPS